MGWRLSWLLLLSACSIDDDLVRCRELLCPIGFVCTVGGCASPEAAAPCESKSDGEACTSTSIPEGTCSGGSCHPVGCGNGILDDGETCDDGNQTYGDGCAADCRSTEVCGNGVTDLLRHEQCDDGGLVGLSNDGCSSTCTLELELWRNVSPRATAPRFDAAMAFDAARGVSVLFGGVGLTYYDDTWQWDGTNWRRLAPASSPPARGNHVMAYDAKRERVVMFGGNGPNGDLRDTWQWDGVTWSERVASTPPPARNDAAMVYDRLRERIVLFGGCSTAGALGDTWEWDGTQWTPVSSSGPPARCAAASAFDPVSNKVLVSGGLGVGGSLLYDTWTWDGVGWTDVTNGAQPGFNKAAMVEDTLRDRIVMFGGYNSGASSTTYVWDGTKWSPLTVTGSTPSGRFAHVMSYDAVRDRAVVFGGWDVDQMFGDTFELDTAQWLAVTPPALDRQRDDAMAYDARRGRVVRFPSGAGTLLFEWDGLNWLARRPPSTPAERIAAGIAYDAARGETVVFGGNSTSPLDETWLWDGASWTSVSPTPRPAARTYPAMAYAPDRGTVILFGGGTTPTQQFDDTWEWNGTSWTDVSGGTRPPARTQHAVAYDPVRRKLVLFGGYSYPVGGMPHVLGDTWEWDGTTWKDLTPTVSPSPRSDHDLVYDPDRKRVVLFGGATSDETWEWNGTTWSRRTPLLAPPGLDGIAIAYDAIHHRTVMFGGSTIDGMLQNDTWTRGFEPPDNAAVERCLVATDDSDGDQLAGCADPDCIGRCAPLCLPGESCDPALPHCGDGTCGPVEDYLICPADCVPPP